jgi:hypothetical protein
LVFIIPSSSPVSSVDSLFWPLGLAPPGPCTALKAEVEVELELAEDEEAAVVGPSVSRCGVG